ncbi:hypothetical protein JTE90_017730 [Oedothorax gibbosus]|uniref:non-specific serine/threonine protein kinase n=1 Tax=Oedothorax gibbosus TaxID=931172 RepID=A0AAV6UDM2_9ARAC|nr:hypothetical protein JTE90_017730 [Oedothorax gibbosus]
MASRLFSQYFHPQKLNLHDSCSKSPFQYFFENALGKTRQVLRVFLGKEPKLSPEIGRSQHRLPIEFFRNDPLVPSRPKFVYRPGCISNLTSKWVSDSIAGAVSKGWRKQVLQRGGGPMMCFVGFVLAKKPSLLTEEEECESVSFFIRDTFAKIPWQNIGLNIDKHYQMNTQFSLSNLKFGDMLAKGCNAAVYSAQYSDNDGKMNQPSTKLDKVTIVEQATSLFTKEHGTERNVLPNEAKEKDEKFSFPQTKIFMPHSEGEIDSKPLDAEKPDLENPQFPTGEFYPYNLAVKMMFNYSAESNSYAIWNAMHKEVLPAIADFTFEEDHLHHVRKKRLKPHPNIVEMYFAFADMVPFLPGACKYFPQALPVRLLNDGCGRNMTLFLVMKRYHCSLKEYLEKYKPSSHTSLLLFTQLLEALAHLYHSNIAHRDLKTDNILLDLSQGGYYPKACYHRFGCCLESLSLNYPSYDISKGGNMALMAPEVVNAEAGPFAMIDYSRADLWTAGTMAYEIFGAKNPFYSHRSNLKNTSYRENSLPALPTVAPMAIKKLVKDMLHRDPKKRPSQTFAATVCQILLHAPPDLLCQHDNSKSFTKTLDWMFLLSSKTFLEGLLNDSAEHDLEFVLRHTFCSRIQYLEVVRALKYILE